MTLITKLNQFSQRRVSWLVLFLSVIFFELCALFFQHGLKLAPCVMCIYERIAMLGIAGAALIGLIAPGNIFFRGIGLLGWGYTAFRGFTLANQHVEYQLHPSPFATCDAFVQLPHWAPLNQWMPWMFKAYGDCSEISWQFLNLSMPQWLVIIFAANILIAVIFILSQLKSSR
ncbi:disulfide bond formation protein DsbB [Vibrio quintilis]|uniref:Disulfide bond formation protein B n=1 Tax=Vibrio quintilis TaxID=1117707 RepID=A0A1M7Z1L7_9VIBR|nr:disulfide bond formation protein DsbB [Vibrio quintilis]SHO58858.1 Disulfide bond formation protein B [Vibrio quintilis]